jgi:hypothetical protein
MDCQLAKAEQGYALDFSIILVLPYGALLGFGFRIATHLAKRDPLLPIWPLALCVLTSLPIFYRFPDIETIGIWAMLAFGLSVWAAIGVMIGTAIARFSIGVVRVFRGYDF